MTVRELADASGVTEQSLLRYLNEKRDIPVPVLYQICEGLKVSVHEVVRRAELRLDD
ncbi:helix-turn-helix domain-containing protein [Arthrobacter sp. USHLN218]|uniref:helix-turn-helix domain-containing protein n=1 Tax=Arthrobacter sp. USHLN218 TaxID=3081232 RepID=UPI003FA56B2E